MDTLIYDFETLSQEPVDGVAVCFAYLIYDSKKLASDTPYLYEELLADAKYIKFDVMEQVEVYKRKIQKGTLDWWGEQSPEVREMIQPSMEDVSVSALVDFTKELDFSKIERVYTRGNTFDPIMLRHICKQCGHEDPTPWWIIRDTRSMIEGMSFGIDLKNTFIPEGLEDKFVGHDPRHDVVMDVMRMQTLAQALVQ